MNTTPAKTSAKGRRRYSGEIVPNSDQCSIYTYMAGGGCSLPGKAMVLMPGAGCEGTRFVLDVMTSYGLECLPAAAGWRWGGDVVETAALLSKKALMRPIGSHNDNERAALLEKCSKTASTKLALARRNVRQYLRDGRQYRKYRTPPFHHWRGGQRRLLVAP